jgi:acyl carrier protein
VDILLEDGFEPTEYCRFTKSNGFTFVNKITPDQVRQFLLARYRGPIEELGLEPAGVPDDFDFLYRGVIDSFGILEMISSIEDEFRIQLDVATLDAEQITILGPLSRYVAENGRINPSVGA